MHIVCKIYCGVFPVRFVFAKKTETIAFFFENDQLLSLLACLLLVALTKIP